VPHAAGLAACRQFLPPPGGRARRPEIKAGPPHCTGKTDTYSNDTIRGDHDASTAAACLSGLRLLAG
jgi:hypothetical protein